MRICCPEVWYLGLKPFFKLALENCLLYDGVPFLVVFCVFLVIFTLK